MPESPRQEAPEDLVTQQLAAAREFDMPVNLLQKAGIGHFLDRPVIMCKYIYAEAVFNVIDVDSFSQPQTKDDGFGKLKTGANLFIQIQHRR